MFRWIYCQLDMLLEQPFELTETLQDLPKMVDETYQQILKRLARTWKLTYRLLQCSTVSVRPLRID